MISVNDTYVSTSGEVIVIRLGASIYALDMDTAKQLRDQLKVAIGSVE